MNSLEFLRLPCLVPVGLPTGRSKSENSLLLEKKGYCVEFLGETRTEPTAEFTWFVETGSKPLTASILFNGEFLLYS